MTLLDKIYLLEQKDDTIIEQFADGYVIGLADGDNISVSDSEELENWINEQIAADPEFYGISLADYLGIAPKHFKVFDDISGEDFGLEQIEEAKTVGYSPYNPLNGCDWENITITATEDCGDYIAVYIAY